MGRTKGKCGTKGCKAQFEYDPNPSGLTSITCPLCHNVTAFQDKNYKGPPPGSVPAPAPVSPPPQGYAAPPNPYGQPGGYPSPGGYNQPPSPYNQPPYRGPPAASGPLPPSMTPSPTPATNTPPGTMVRTDSTAAYPAPQRATSPYSSPPNPYNNNYVVVKRQQNGLPEGWEVRNDPQGRPYFVNHSAKSTSYDDPRKDISNCVQCKAPIQFSHTGIVTQVKCYSCQFQNTFGNIAQMSQIKKENSFEIDTSTTEISDIQLGERLGGGAFGDVFKGLWQGTTNIALKSLKDKEGAKEFMAEVTLLKALNHVNVVRFLGTYTDKQQLHYVVTEFCSKGSLNAFLQKDREKLKILELLHMSRDTAAGMRYLASRSIVHRDLAARNLLVKHEDERYIIKVSDFGLSRATNNYYKTTNSVFPVKWSPPEVIEYERFSTKSDVWSFGIVLWEIFEFGKVPYPGKSNDEAKNAVLKGYRLEKPETCPNDVYQVMLLCWDKDEAKRPDFTEIFGKMTEIVASKDPSVKRHSVDPPASAYQQPPAPQVYSPGQRSNEQAMYNAT